MLVKPHQLQKGDQVALISLSSGVLGEKQVLHERKLGEKRLKELGLKFIYMPNSLKGTTYLKKHPNERANDLKEAFMNPEIKAIIAAIGGDDTYRLLPYLMEDSDFIKAVQTSPKLFTGFSDTTNNHLMFYRLGMQSFYGPNFLNDLAELDVSMLEYTLNTWNHFFINPPTTIFLQVKLGMKNEPIFRLKQSIILELAIAILVIKCFEEMELFKGDFGVAA